MSAGWGLKAVKCCCLIDLCKKRCLLPKEQSETEPSLTLQCHGEFSQPVVTYRRDIPR